ncbi:MAG: hypothetical protein WBW61_00540 [Rhodanobacteraceae bacterium]
MAEAPFGHESPAINTGRVLTIGAILGCVVVGAVIALHFILDYGVMPQRAAIVARSGRIPPLPRLQPHPARDLAALRVQKQTLLSSYAWIDATHRYARIPIGRAMALYLRQHSASASSPRPLKPTAPATPAPQPRPMGPKRETAKMSGREPKTSMRRVP